MGIFTKHSSPSYTAAAQRIFLDPEEAEREKAKKAYSYHVFQIPCLRAFGLPLIALAVLLHNLYLVPTPSAWTDFWRVLTLYADYIVVSWLILLVFYTKIRKFNLGMFFLLFDIILFLIAVYYSGGEKSWLFFLLVMRAADQTRSTRRNTVLFAIASTAGYVLLLLYLAYFERRALSIHAELAKVWLVFGSNMYLSFVAKTSDHLRNSMISAVRISRDLIRQINRSQEALQESEVRYRLLAENATDLIWTLDMNLRLTYVSPSVTRILGFTAEGAMALSVQQACTPAALEKAMQIFAEEMATESGGLGDPRRSRVMELELVHKDGSSVPIEGNFCFLRDRSGKAVGILAIARDITQRRRAEEALRKSEEKYRQIVETANEGICVTDADNIITYVNQKMADMLGHLPEEIIGKPLVHFMFPEDLADHREKWSHRLQGLDETYERRFRRSDGRECWTHISVTVVRAEDGRFMGAFGMLTDITERKQAENALQESAEINSAIVNQAIEGIVLVDSETLRFVEFNDAACNGLGYSREEFARLTLFDVQESPTLVEFTERVREEVDAGHAHFENRQRRKDGSLRDVLISNRVVNLHERKYWVAIWLDITDRKRMEEALRESELRFRTILQTANEGFWLIDNDTVTRDVNPKMCAILGRAEEEILGRKIFDFVDSENRAIFEHQVKLRAQGQIGAYEIALSRPDGSHVFCQFNVTPLFDASGSKVGAFAMVTDITGRKQAEKEKEKLEAQLHQAQKMEAIGLLAGGIAHDFNNILSAIMGFTELSLFKIQEDSPARNNMAQVLKASMRASEVVKQILTFTRQGLREPKRIGIASMVEETLKLLRSSLPSTIEIHQELSVMPGEDVVMGDPSQIHQVLMNLSTNAGHAMRAKGGTLTVKVSAVSDALQLPANLDLKAGRYVCISVSDTGHGMDSATLERIFDPYFTTKGPGEGTGLGLSVVQGIVKSHGGAITVQSRPGQGTTFFVFLPGLGKADAGYARALEAPPNGSERILFVDDEEALVDMGKEALETLGYHVTAMTSSLDALETFRAQPNAFDLVITDMTMPSLTGTMLAKEIIAFRPDTPIILSSGFSDQVNEEKIKEAGIREFVMKPYEIYTLAVAIRKALVKR